MKIIVQTPTGLGEILQSARKARGLTQAQAAAQLGIGQPRLSALETTATASLSLEQMLALFALYGLELCVQSRETAGAGKRIDTETPEW
jgi:HTH-type transcriptional regulator/antitoxin HipB